MSSRQLTLIENSGKPSATPKTFKVGARNVRLILPSRGHLRLRAPLPSKLVPHVILYQLFKSPAPPLDQLGEELVRGPDPFGHLAWEALPVGEYDLVAHIPFMAPRIVHKAVSVRAAETTWLPDLHLGHLLTTRMLRLVDASGDPIMRCDIEIGGGVGHGRPRNISDPRGVVRFAVPSDRPAAPVAISIPDFEGVVVGPEHRGPVRFTEHETVLR